MKKSIVAASILLVLVCMPLLISARHSSRSLFINHGNQKLTEAIAKTKDEINVARPNFNWERRPMVKHRGPDTLQVAGSTLPDCSHACGSCSPCRLVMVSFVCSSLEEAETCPMAYKCMCHNKSYPVP